MKEMSEGELVSGCRDQVDGWVGIGMVGLLTKYYTGIEVSTSKGDVLNELANLRYVDDI